MQHTPVPETMAPQHVFRPPPEDDDSIDIRAILSILWRGKWIIAFSALVGLTLAFFWVSQLETRYRSSAKVIFDQQERNITNIEQVIVSDFSRERMQNELEVLRSTALIERVIDSLNLNQNPEFNPSLLPREPTLRETYFPWLTLPPEAEQIGRGIGLIRPDPPAPDPETLRRRQRLAVIGRVRAGLQLRPVPNSSIIEISFTSARPRTAASIANEIADQYIVEQLEGKLDATRSATEWLSERVLELQQKVEASENAVVQLRAQLTQDAGQSLEITQAQLSELNGALSAAQSREVSLSAQYDRLVVALEQGLDIGAIPEFRESALISTLRGEENDLVSREVTLRASVRESHPSIVRLRGQRDEVQRKIREEAGRLVESIQVERDAATSEIEALTATVRELETKAVRQSAAEIELRQLEREAQASRLLYENFLGRLQETSQQESLQTADARVITPAEVPRFPLSQSRKRGLAMGGIFGLLAGIGIVFFLNRLANTFRTPKEIEDMIGLPVLGSVPAAGPKMKRRDILQLFRDKPNSSLAEAVRNLRTSILFSDVDHPPKTLMLTSSIPREGKSTTSALIAMTSQQMGRSTILVDCDFRLPALSTILQFDADKPGVLSLMNGTAELDEVISVEPDSGLHILMARPNEAKTLLNPADVLSSKKFADLVADLSSKYDLVILDTPPALVVSDARIVSKLADVVLYVVKWDSTPHGVVQEGIAEMRSIGARLIGAAMTMVDEAKAASYSYGPYNYGYYRGRYRDYYVE